MSANHLPLACFFLFLSCFCTSITILQRPASAGRDRQRTAETSIDATSVSNIGSRGTGPEDPMPIFLSRDVVLASLVSLSANERCSRVGGSTTACLGVSSQSCSQASFRDQQMPHALLARGVVLATPFFFPSSANEHRSRVHRGISCTFRCLVDSGCRGTGPGDQLLVFVVSSQASFPHPRMSTAARCAEGSNACLVVIHHVVLASLFSGSANEHCSQVRRRINSMSCRASSRRARKPLSLIRE